MTHDPLCVQLYKQVIPTTAERCIACLVITKVREDMLAKCIAVIEAMPLICDDLDWPFLDLSVPEIISEIKATLQSEQ